jgi:putative ABC transport system permease protein
VDHLLADARFALRALLRHRGFTTVAVVTLALGMGATTAIFSVIQGVLLRPLPYEEADRVVMLWQTARQNPRMNIGGSVSHLNFLDWKKEAKTISSMALFAAAGMTVGGEGGAEALRGAIVTPGFFDVLRARPVIGRDFSAEEDLPSGPRVAVISDGLWRERFGARPDVLSQTIEISGFARQIVGVAPPGFDFPRNARVWLPVRNDDRACGRSCVYLDGIGRLRDTAEVEAARSEMTAIARRLESAYPNDNTGVTAGLETLPNVMVGDVRPALLVLFGAVAMVLLIACANVANLLLVRGAARQGDLAVRSALGASRRRLLVHLLAESLVLAVIGAGAGMLLAGWGIDALKALSPGDIPRLDEVSIDRPTLVFALGMALLTSLLFGLGPSAQLSRVSLATVLARGGGRGEVATRHAGWGRSTLLVVEVALSLVLLVGAGLLLRSFARLQDIDPGWKAADLSVFTLSLPPARYATDRDVIRAYDRLDDRLAALPGVDAVARISGLPLGPSENVFSFTRPDQPPPAPGRAPSALFRVVDPEYFRTLGIPIVAGRGFESFDRAGSLPVIVIGRRMAEEFWRGENPIGKQVTVGNGSPIRTIVGVAADVRSASLTVPPSPEMYVPQAQDGARAMTFVLRSRLPAGDVLEAARLAVRAFDPRLPLFHAGAMQALLDDASARPRFYLLLLGLFALLAVVLAAVGIYGVVAYLVTERRREIGIRIALGARRLDVIRLIAWQGVKPAMVGLVLGLVGAASLGSLLGSMLYEVRAGDPMAFGAVVALLLAVVLLACLVPAAAATRVPPTQALRSE